MRCPLSIFLALLPCLTQMACSSNDEGPAPTPPLPGPAEWNRDVVPPSDMEAETQRTACGYKSGSLPAETQGESRPSGDQIPIDHIVVVMMENRSFDHYFQKLPEYGQPDVEVAPETFTNPGPDATPVAPFHDTQFCFVDTNHEWSGVHQQANGGKMDGFVTSNESWGELPVKGQLEMKSGKRAMAYYDQTDLPFYYWLASEFALGDHYHSSILGPTWPNRLYLYAATSFGQVHNDLPTVDKTLFDYLDLRQVSWKVYYSTTPGMAIMLDKYLQYTQEGHFVNIDQYFKDAAAGTLPSVVFIDPGLAREGYAQNDEHPPAIAKIGEGFVASVVDSLTKSPNWSSSALFLTYDEHGGLYDHVVPPPACPPDDTTPILKDGDPDAKFDQLGIRVPFMVVSPFAKKHFVGHRTYDHTSIVRFIEARHRIPALTNRDANAEAPWEMFDFDKPPHATPPAVTIPATDQAKIDACAAVFEE